MSLLFKNILKNLPVSIICIGNIIKLYLGKIKKKENKNIFNKYNIIINLKLFDSFKESNAPKNELMLIIIRGTRWKGL